MQIHCPQCKHVFEKTVDSPDERIGCPSCAVEFTLSEKATIMVEKRSPEIPGPGSRLGGYLIEREIGRGGMGIVYQGIQESLGRRVAIKVLYPKYADDKQFVARFNREAKSLANLNHPNIVSILDRGVEGGIFYFVMEFINGISLRHLMAEGDISSKQALGIVPKICQALEYAHSQGVIHRDIKPENILIDKQGQVKIADFGLSRIIRGDREETRITRSNLVMGTVDYMAPEQRLDSKSVDHRADIYSLGVVLYELLTGELPLGRFDPPSKKNLEVDIRIDDVVLKVLDKDPDLRYQRASEVGDDISRITDGGSPAGRPGARSPDGEKSLLEKLEDKWESWVLAATVVLFFLNPATNWLLFVAWGVLYYHIKAKRKARGPAGVRRIPVRPAAKGEEGRAVPLRVEEEAEAPPPPSPPPPPVPFPPPAPASPQTAPTDRSLSFMAVAVLLYTLCILLVFPIVLPFHEELMAEFTVLPAEEMAVVLSIVALAVIPGFLGLILAIVARGRIAASVRLTGAAVASLAILLNLGFIAGTAVGWHKAYKTFRRWKQIEEGIAARDPAMTKKLFELAGSPEAEKAFRLAGKLPPDASMTFFLKGLENRRGHSEIYAVRGLTHLAPRGKTAAVGKTFREILTDLTRSERVKRETVQQSQYLPVPEALTVLRAGAASEMPTVRRTAADILENIRAEEGQDLLVALALDPVPSVAREAVRSLADRPERKDPERTVERLGTVLDAARHPGVLEEVVTALEKMIRRDGSFPLTVLEHLSRAAASERIPPAVRAKAAQALERAYDKIGKDAARQKDRAPGRRLPRKSAIPKGE
jgi:tRNA A-37 threonylcarbamoyl transferase component Bud32